jgi:hypothetical protein
VARLLGPLSELVGTGFLGQADLVASADAVGGLSCLAFELLEDVLHRLVVADRVNNPAVVVVACDEDGSVSGGHWSDVVKPTIETSYQAKWKSATSSTISVKVRPLITLTLLSQATGRFSTKVSAARSFAGKFVLVQRLSSTGVSTLKRVTLDANSAANFRVRLQHGRSRLRVVMPTSQTQPGYITGTSNVVTVLH